MRDDRLKRELMGSVAYKMVGRRAQSRKLSDTAVAVIVLLITATIIIVMALL